MIRRLIMALLLIHSAGVVCAQFTYRLDQSIPVDANGVKLSLPWAGGLNAAQFNTMDVDGDGDVDLVVFERTANKVLTFINDKKTWRYAPEYESLFPAGVDQWLLLRDFNCDGRKDIFTHNIFGISVFVNTTRPGGQLQWRPFNEGNAIVTQGYTAPVNLQVNATDISGIDDVDGDGDLDILDARFVGIGSVEYHRNMSIENTGKCDSMQFVRITEYWGNFEECNCGEYLYGGDNCTIFGGRLDHAAGKSILTIDVDNDGDRDLLFSEETCSAIYFLRNMGTPDSANMTGFTSYPEVHPIENFQIFPATYYEDVDFDGIPDLLVGSNVYNRSLFSVDFRSSAWLYKNNGTVSLPDFTFVKNNFLQDQMIETGDNASPALIDVDGDDDLDLFVSSYNSTATPSYVYYYENTGTQSAPAYTFRTSDYATMSRLNFYNMKIQFADMNADGRMDFVFTATSSADGTTGLYYFPNSTQGQLTIPSTAAPVNTGFAISTDENILIVDVDLDGSLDVLAGTSVGELQYWRNSGDPGSTAWLLQNGSFLGLGVSTDRQNPVVSAGDLNADGKIDLIMGDQRGELTVYNDFRSLPQTGEKNIIWDSVSQTYTTRNLGGRIWPVVANIFNSAQPAIVAGNLLGGIQILKNDNPGVLPEEAVVGVYPNPVVVDNTTGERIVYISSNRDASVQFYTLLGQPTGNATVVDAFVKTPIAINSLHAGAYILKITTREKTFTRRIIVP